jgi:hypothetical protein
MVKASVLLTMFDRIGRFVSSRRLDKMAEKLLPHTCDFASECNSLGTARMWAVDGGRMNLAVRPCALDFNDLQDARVGM